MNSSCALIQPPQNESASRLSGLYIHIPFCLSRCRYCSFFSTTSQDMIPHFIKAVSLEMSRYRGVFSCFDTVYLGGGTPSLLSPANLYDIISSIRRNFVLTPDVEFTIEVNPGDLTLEYARTLRSFGVNRISIGIQSFDDAMLSFLGRRHSAREAADSLEAACAAGFSNISIDMIYGIPGQSLATWHKTLKIATSYSPEHLSCYQLTVEPHTPMAALINQGALKLPDEDLEYRFFMSTSQLLSDAGYVQYEVSNYAKNDAMRSRHNQKYWSRTPYLGLGPAAHSFRDEHRWWNCQSLVRYIHAMNTGNNSAVETEILTDRDVAAEIFLLSMRTIDGITINTDMLTKLLAQREFASIINKLASDGFIHIDNGGIKPTVRGLAVADKLALLFLQHLS